MAYLETLTRQALRASIQPDGRIRLEPDWLITDSIRQMVRERREELIREITENAAPGDPSVEVVPDYHLLWVATDLDSFEEFDPRFGYEVGGDPVYRMLDAPYYAWLRHRMENVRKAYESGRLNDADFETLRTRFNTIHSWAVRHIGEDALRRAVRTTNMKSYVPPSDQTFAAYRKTWDDAWEAYQQNQVARSRTPQPSDQARKLQHLLDTQGYAGIRSSIVEDIVVFVRDDSVVVPAKWTGNVRFTMDELRLMVGSTPEAVKQICEVKRVFGGKVVPTGDDPFAGTVPAARPTPVSVGQQSLSMAAVSVSAK